MRKILVLCVIAVFLATSDAVASGKFRVSAGPYFSTGKYSSDSTTDIQAITFALRYKTGYWTFKASIPYLWITGDGSRFGIEGDPAALPDDSRRTEHGLGDLFLTASYLAYYDRDTQWGASVKGKVKVPTGDYDKRLGTGEFDYLLEVAPFKVIDKTTLYGAIAYKIYGDPPGVDYDNVWLWRAGAMHKFTGIDDIGLSFGYRQRLVGPGVEKRTGMLFWTRRFDRKIKVQSYVIKGLSKAAADWAGGVSLMADI